MEWSIKAMMDEAITLEQALQQMDEETLLSDGADHWDKWNLLDALKGSDEGRAFLQRKVNVTHAGIFFVKEDGYLESLPVYAFWEPE
jgi:hypothetical protein